MNKNTIENHNYSSYWNSLQINQDDNSNSHQCIMCHYEKCFDELYKVF